MSILDRSTNKHQYQVVNTEYLPVHMNLEFINLELIWFVSTYLSLSQLNRAHLQINLKNITEKQRHSKTYLDRHNARSSFIF